MLFIKFKIKTFLKENQKKKLQIYIKWTTKFKTLTVSIKYTSLLGFATLTYAAWEPHSNKIIQGAVVAWFPNK